MNLPAPARGTVGGSLVLISTVVCALGLVAAGIDWLPGGVLLIRPKAMEESFFFNLLWALLTLVVGLAAWWFTSPRFSPLPETCYFNTEPIPHAVARWVVQVGALLGFWWSAFGATGGSSLYIGFFASVWLVIGISCKSAEGTFRRMWSPVVRRDLSITPLAPTRLLLAAVVFPCLRAMAFLLPMLVALVCLLLTPRGDYGDIVEAPASVVIFIVLITMAACLAELSVIMSQGDEQVGFTGRLADNLMRQMGTLVICCIGAALASRMGESWGFHSVRHLQPLEQILYLSLAIVMAVVFVHRAREALVHAALGYRYVGEMRDQGREY